MEEQYLIESLEHRHDDNVVWWKPNRLGYTDDLTKAGRYGKKEAEEICSKANITGELNERCWPESWVFGGKIDKFIVQTVAVYR